jgi:hypothetical protein
MSDLRSGLDIRREKCVVDPPDLPMYCENFLVTAYDHRNDVGFWLHLGTVPWAFERWEDQALIFLPGDGGILWMYSTGVPAVADRPAGSCLSFSCVEPFRRWRVTFSGMAVRTPYEEFRTGRVRDGPKEPLSFEMELACRTPVWDQRQSAMRNAGPDSVTIRSAEREHREHYQQLFDMTGHLALLDAEWEVAGTGFRDHSLGQRGHNPQEWGGHALVTALFPDGRAFGMTRMWRPDGEVTRDGGYVVVDGELHDATILRAPSLDDLVQRAEPIEVELAWASGHLALVGETVQSAFMTMTAPRGQAYGADPAFGGRGILSEAFTRWEWDGVVTHGFTERSAQLRGVPVDSR